MDGPFEQEHGQETIQMLNQEPSYGTRVAKYDNNIETYANKANGDCKGFGLLDFLGMASWSPGGDLVNRILFYNCS